MRRRERLPPDVWDHVFGFLGVPDVVRASMVSKELCRTARAHRPAAPVPVFAPAGHVQIAQRAWPQLPIAEVFGDGDNAITCCRKDGPMLVVAYARGELAQIDTRTGRTVWRADHGERANAWTLAVSGPFVFAAHSGGAALKALKATGETVWKHPLPCGAKCICVKAGDLYVGCADGVVKRIGPAGEVRWVHDFDTDVTSVLVADGQVHFVDIFGYGATLDAATGRRVGGLWMCMSSHTTRLCRAVRSATGGGTSCVVQSVYECEPCCPASPECDPDDPECEGVVVSHCALSMPRGLAPAQGVVWEFMGTGYVDSVTVDGSRLWFACRNNRIRQLDLRTGRIVWEWDHPGVVYDVHVSDGAIYTSCSDGHVRRVRL